MLAYYTITNRDTTSLGEQVYTVYFEIEITASMDIEQIERRLGITIVR